MNMLRSNVRNFLVALTIPEVLEVRAGWPHASSIGYIDEWLSELCEECMGEPCMTGTMRTDVKFLGSGLTLKVGTRVVLTAATNLPYLPLGWFAYPVDDRDDWRGGEGDSILLTYDDITDLEVWEG